MPLDYSKWDNIELSDDEDIECHPNIDKKSFIRWRQADIHRKRDERRDRINALQEELIKAAKENHPDIQKLKDELEKLENEEKKTLTIDNLCKPGFDKTILNKSKSDSKSSSVSKSKQKESVIEVLNPEVLQGSSNDSNVTSEESRQKKHVRGPQHISDPNLQDFALVKSFDESFKFISDHSYIISQQNSDEIMAGAFTAEMDGMPSLAKNYVGQALILQYCVSLGQDGVGLFFKRISSPDHQARKLFEDDLQRTYAHIQARSKVLLEKRAKNERSIFDGAAENQDSLKPLGSLPQAFKDALLTEDLDKVNAALATMTESEAKRCLGICKETGLLDLDDDDIVVIDPNEEGTNDEATSQAVDPKA